MSNDCTQTLTVNRTNKPYHFGNTYHTIHTPRFHQHKKFPLPLLPAVDMATKRSVTFQEELVTDTWLVPCIGGRSLRKYPSRQLRRLRKIILSGAGAEAAWRVLTNSENNHGLVALCRDDPVTRNVLDLVLESASLNWNRAVNDIGEGLTDLQEEHDPDSEIPSIDSLSDALSALYGAPRFQSNFIHDLPSPMGHSQVSTEATSGGSQSFTSNDSESRPSTRSSASNDSSSGDDDDQVHVDDQGEEPRAPPDEERPQEVGPRYPRPQRSPPRPIYQPEKKRRRQN